MKPNVQFQYFVIPQTILDYLYRGWEAYKAIHNIVLTSFNKMVKRCGLEATSVVQVLTIGKEFCRLII